MRTAEFSDLNDLKPSLETIKDLKSSGWIKNSWPYWWSTDYEPDPRVYLNYKDFEYKLVYIGKFIPKFEQCQRDLLLYPEPDVPVSVVSLDVKGHELPFLITARPYHEKEIEYSSHYMDLRYQPVEKPLFERLQGYLKEGNSLRLPRHFQPHIRGLFAGVRGTHLFYYPLGMVDNKWESIEDSIEEAFLKEMLYPLYVYHEPYLGGNTYQEIYWEMEANPDLFDTKDPKRVDFAFNKVSIDEFLDQTKNGQNQQGGEQMVLYPLRLPGFKHTFPLVIVSRTHRSSRLFNPAILGVYSSVIRGYRMGVSGIWRIKDEGLASVISREMTQDLGINIDTVVFKPAKGRPIYERVSA